MLLPLGHLFVYPDIKHIRRVTGFGLEYLNTVVADEPADRAFLVIPVAENTGTGRAGLDAGGLQPFGYPVVTPIALIADSLLMVEVACAVGAGLYTVLAANAVLVVDQHHAVLGLIR